MSPPRTSKEDAVELLKAYREDILKTEIARVEGRLETHETRTEGKFKELDSTNDEHRERFHGIDRRQDGLSSSIKEVHSVAMTIQKTLEKGHVNGRVMAFFVVTTILTAAGLIVAIFK